MNMLKIKIADGGENYNEGLASPKTAENLSIKPKQQASFVQSQFNLMLNFKDPKDDELYTNTLRDLFYFPTFIPIMIIIIAFAFVFGNQDELTRDARRGWVMVILYMIFALGTFVLLLAFAVAQFFEYMDTSLKTPPWVGRASNYVLRKFAYGRIPDCILMLSAIAQGLNFMLVAAGNFCSSCGNLFMITSCEEGMYRNFPWQKVFFSYTVQLILPIFLKSTNRHLSFFSMIVVTGFMVVALIIGEYSYSNQLVFVVVAFHMSMFEFERYRMMSFLLGKEALNFEKTKQEKTKADAHAQLERRMNQALLQQILPAPVARQLLSGNKVAPEQFEEVTIFFSDVVGFTNICAAVSPIQVVKMLNELYTVMDYCTSHFPLYKVETIGDAYMVRLSPCWFCCLLHGVRTFLTLSALFLSLPQLVGGLPVRDSHHAQQIADFALLVQTAVQAVKSPADGSPINIRIGKLSSQFQCFVRACPSLPQPPSPALRR
jgi:class 3 adenylate cyclase